MTGLGLGEEVTTGIVGAGHPERVARAVHRVVGMPGAVVRVARAAKSEVMTGLGEEAVGAGPPERVARAVHQIVAGMTTGLVGVGPLERVARAVHRMAGMPGAVARVARAAKSEVMTGLGEEAVGAGPPGRVARAVHRVVGEEATTGIAGAVHRITGMHGVVARAAKAVLQAPGLLKTTGSAPPRSQVRATRLRKHLRAAWLRRHPSQLLMWYHQRSQPSQLLIWYHQLSRPSLLIWYRQRSRPSQYLWYLL